MTFMSLAQIEQGLKQGIYRFRNRADGCALVWDAARRQYIGHVESAILNTAMQNAGLSLLDWVGYGQGESWGSDGW